MANPESTKAAFPNEILLHVFSHLQRPPPFEPQYHPVPHSHPEPGWIDPEQDFDDPLFKTSTALTRICRASKLFRDLAQPLLYESLIVRHLGTAEPLLVTLCTYPHLAQMVKQLDLHLEPDVRPPAQRLQELWAKAGPHQGIPSELVEAISFGLGHDYDQLFHDAAITFWLALVPNLTTLTISAPENPRCLPQLIADQLMTPGRHFSSLQDVTLWPPYEDARMTIGTMEAIFKIPSLEYFAAWCVDWTGPDGFTDFFLPPSASGLACIRIGCAKVQPICTRSLLSTCGNLSELSLNIDLVRPDLDAYDLGDMLRAHGQNLESITVSFTVSMVDHFGVAMVGGTDVPCEDYLASKIGSLKGLTRLKSLILGLDWDLGSPPEEERTDEDEPRQRLPLLEILPSGLESMLLEWKFRDEDALGEDLCGLAESKAFPHLRCVRVKGGPKLPREIGHLGWEYRESGDGTFTHMDKWGMCMLPV
ncbi:hypothetical protein ACJ41O_014607 [Fusarium nematophilum]